MLGTVLFATYALASTCDSIATCTPSCNDGDAAACLTLGQLWSETPIRDGMSELALHKACQLSSTQGCEALRDGVHDVPVPTEVSPCTGLIDCSMQCDDGQADSCLHASRGWQRHDDANQALTLWLGARGCQAGSVEGCHEYIEAFRRDFVSWEAVGRTRVHPQLEASCLDGDYRSCWHRALPTHRGTDEADPTWLMHMQQAGIDACRDGDVAGCRAYLVALEPRTMSEQDTHQASKTLKRYITPRLRRACRRGDVDACTIGGQLLEYGKMPAHLPRGIVVSPFPVDAVQGAGADQLERGRQLIVAACNDDSIDDCRKAVKWVGELAPRTTADPEYLARVGRVAQDLCDIDLSIFCDFDVATTAPDREQLQALRGADGPTLATFVRRHLIYRDGARFAGMACSNGDTDACLLHALTEWSGEHAAYTRGCDDGNAKSCALLSALNDELAAEPLDPAGPAALATCLAAPDDSCVVALHAVVAQRRTQSGTSMASMMGLSQREPSGWPASRAMQLASFKASCDGGHADGCAALADAWPQTP